MMFQIEVNREKCNGSGTCARVCPKGPKIWKIEGNGKSKKAYVIDASFCLLCGMCVTMCPVNAITISFGRDEHVSTLGTANE
jgi:ferredoxin